MREEQIYVQARGGNAAKRLIIVEKHGKNAYDYSNGRPLETIKKEETEDDRSFRRDRRNPHRL